MYEDFMKILGVPSYTKSWETSDSDMQYEREWVYIVLNGIYVQHSNIIYIMGVHKNVHLLQGESKKTGISKNFKLLKLTQF